MTNKIDVSMKKLLFVLMMLCAVMNVQAQTIQVGQKFWDGHSHPRFCGGHMAHQQLA